MHLPRNFLCDRVFHLQSGIYFNEIVLSMFVQKELDGSCVFVTDMLCDVHRISRHRVSNLRRQIWGRSDLDDLLMPSLNGAVSFVQMNDVSIAISEDLHLDVTRSYDVLLEEQRSVAEGG